MNIVIGGGAAGMMSAGVMAGRGVRTMLLERNDRLGKKLYITGKGRCNLTNAVDVQTMMENIPGNSSFLYSALYTFDSAACIEFFNKLGVPTKVERGNRVFPVSDKASDIVHSIERFIRRNNVDVRLNTGVREINDNYVLTDSGDRIEYDNIVIATGGLSYPMTGSTGDGYKFAKAIGHTITKLYPSLVPLKTRETWTADLQGLSLKNIAINLKVGNRSVYRDFGEMLFTHYGISGPVVLSASRHLVGCDSALISIDLKPALTSKELDERILRDFKRYINKSFKNSLGDLLPQKLIPVIVTLSGIASDCKVHDITKAQRRRLVELIKNLELNITGSAGYDEAVITCGGISINEIEPGTMRSKLAPKVYFSGEIIDVDAYTGGFNLQIAFATGYLVGMSI